MVARSACGVGVFGPFLIAQDLGSFPGLQLSRWKKAGCSVSHHHVAVGWSALCDCGFSWSTITNRT